MNKCLKITCSVTVNDHFTQALQKQAHKLKIEGIMHVIAPDSLKITICGPKDSVDSFIDYLYKQSSPENPLNIEVEPFLKDKDYRGVFRVIA